MNRPMKIPLTLLGITASVGLWSQIAAPTTSLYQKQGRHTVHKSGGGSVLTHLTVPEIPSSTTLVVNYYPASTPHQRNLWNRGRDECKKCGQECSVYRGCWRLPTEEDVKHLHLSPKAEARMIKSIRETEKLSEKKSP